MTFSRLFFTCKRFLEMACYTFETITNCNVNPCINKYYWRAACKSICSNINTNYASKHWNIIYKQLYTKYLPKQKQMIYNLTYSKSCFNHQQTSLTLHGLCQVCIDDNVDIIKMLIFDKKNFPDGIETRFEFNDYNLHNYDYLSHCGLLELSFCAMYGRKSNTFPINQRSDKIINYLLSLDTLKSVNNFGYCLDKLKIKSPQELADPLMNYTHYSHHYYESNTRTYSLFLRLILTQMYEYCLKLLKHPMFDFDLIRDERYHNYKTYYTSFAGLHNYDMTLLHAICDDEQVGEIDSGEEITTRLTILKEIISILAENGIVEACINVIWNSQTSLDLLISNLACFGCNTDNYRVNFGIAMEIIDLLISKLNPKNIENISRTLVNIIEKTTKSEELCPLLLKKVLNHAENGVDLLLNTIYKDIDHMYTNKANRNLFYLACEKGNTPCVSFIYDYLLTNTGITSKCKTNKNYNNGKYYSRLKDFFNAKVQNYHVYEYQQADMTPYIRACYSRNMELVRCLVLHCKDFVDITQILTNTHSDVDLDGSSALYQRGSDLFQSCAQTTQQKVFYRWLVEKENERADAKTVKPAQ